MKRMQKLLSLLLVLAMLIAMAPATVRVSAEEIVSDETVPVEETTTQETVAEEPAEEETPAEEPAAEEETAAASGEVDSYDAGIPTLTGSGTIPFQLNPLYEGILTADHFPKADFSHMQGDTSAVQADYVSRTDAAAQVRQYMLNRTSYYTINVATTNADAWGEFDELLAEAMAHNGNPKEGDCLQWQYGGWEASYSYYYSNSRYHYSFDIYMPYYTTYSQEVELDAAVASLLSQLNLWSATDYEKVCGVYDYICDNVVYDYEHVNDDSYKLQFTAYAALVDKVAVCQGYAVLFYRLMLELGVDARVIVGDGGGPHAWNIVELDNLYYNLDSTWDAGVSNYNYFLQSPRDFMGHTREPEYETAAFHAAYPMSPTSYGKEEEIIEATPISLDTWYTVYIDTPGAAAYFSFTPAETGYYNLSANSGGYDTRCALYNASWSAIGSNDDSETSYDFSLTAELVAGETYYFGVDYYGGTTGSFDIILTVAEGGGGSADVTPSGKIENYLAAEYEVSDLILDAAGVFRTPDGCVVYIAIDNYGDGGLYWLNGSTLKECVDSFGSTYFDMSDWEALVTLMDSDGYVVLTEETLQYLITTITGNPNWEETEDHVKCYLFYDSVPGGTPEPEIVTLTLDDLEAFTITTGGGWVDCAFTPTVSGYYALNAYSDGDTYCNMYDAAWNYLGSNDDTGEGQNFYMNAWLDAGETYYYEFFFYADDATGTIQVVVTDGLAPSETKVQNYTAEQYTIADLVLGSDNIYRTPTGYPMYIAVNNVCDGGLKWLNGDTLYDIGQCWGSSMLDMTYMDELADLMDADGYVLLTGTTLQYLITTITGNPNWEETEEFAGRYLFYDTGADPQPEPEPGILPLTLDQPATVTITTGGAYAYYSFTPAETGFYALMSASNGGDTWCSMYDSEWEFVTYVDDNGPGADFYVADKLYAGVTYYFEVGYFGETTTGSFQIVVKDAVRPTASGKMENSIAANYAISDLVLGSDNLYRTPDGCLVYIAWDNNEEGGIYWIYNNTLENYLTQYGEEYFDTTYWFDLYDLMDEDGYVLLTPTTLQYLVTTITGNPAWGESAENAAYYLFYDLEPTPEQDPEPAILPLILDQTATVTMNSGDGEAAYYSFTPVYEGFYVLIAESADEDTCCVWYDSGWNECGTADDSGFGLDFCLTVYLDAGETYYFAVSYYDPEQIGSFRITMVDGVRTTDSGKRQNQLWEYYAVSNLVLGADGFYRTPDGCLVYIAVDNDDEGGLYWLSNETLADAVYDYGETAFDLTYWYDLYGMSDEDGYVPLTPTTLQYLITTITGNPNWGETEDYVKHYLFYDSVPTQHTHTYVDVVTAPTCTEDGYTTHTCTGCGDSYVDSYVDAIGHVMGNWYTVAEATCTAKGSERRDCDNCDHFETRETDMIPHNYESVVTAPTYDADGYTTHTCVVCGYSYKDNYVPALVYHEVLEGENARWDPAAEEALSVRVDALVENLLEVWLNGEILDVKYYTVTEGSTIITLKPEYLATLPAGEHTLTLYFTTGSAEVTFVILSPDTLLGDVNGDGEIDILDANLVVAWYNEIRELNDDQLLAADVNGDGEVDIMDANMIVAYYNEIIDVFPVAKK